MSINLVVQIGRELLLTAMLLALPTVLASLGVGLIVSILQTITSVQEQTLNFAPRIIAVGIVLILTLPWTIRTLVHFTENTFAQIVQVTQ